MKKVFMFLCLLFVCSFNVNAATLSSTNECGSCNGQDAKSSWNLNGANCGATAKVTTGMCTDQKKYPLYKEVCDNVPGSSTTVSKPNNYNIVIMVDTTSSMAQKIKNGKYKYKYDLANASIQKLISIIQKKNPNSTISIYGFHSDVYSLIKGENVKASDLNANDDYVTKNDVTKKSHSGGTYTQLGIKKAYDLLKGKKDSIPVLILMTDGLPTIIDENYELDEISDTGGSRLISASPAKYFYYTLRTLIDFKQKISNAKIFTIGIMPSSDRLGNYLLNPTTSNYNNLSSAGNEATVLYNLLSGSGGQNASRLYYDMVAGHPSGVNADYDDITGTLSDDKKTIIYVVDESYSSWNTIRAMFAIDKSNLTYKKGNKNKNTKVTVRVNGDEIADKCSKAINRYDDDNRRNPNFYYCNVELSKRRFDEKPKGKIIIEITVNHGELKTYTINNFTDYRDYKFFDSNNPVNGSYIGTDIDDSFLEKIADNIYNGPVSDPKITCKQVENGYLTVTNNKHSGVCNTKTINIDGGDGRPYYYKTTKTGFDNSGRSISSGSYVQIRGNLSLKLLVTENSSFNFGNLSNNSIYAGGGFGIGNTKIVNTVTWKYSKVSDKNHPIFENIFLNLFEKNVDGKLILDNVAVSNIDTTEVYKKVGNNYVALTDNEVRNNIISKLSLRDGGFEFSSTDSNDANKGSIKHSYSSSKVSSSEVNSNNSVAGFVKSITKTYENYNLKYACVSKDSTVTYVDSEAVCNGLVGGRSIYVPMNYRNNSFGINASGNISSSNDVSVNVNGSCGISVYNINYYYRSINEQNPFPKNIIPDNWLEYKKKDNNFNRVKKSYDNYNKYPDYSYSGMFDFTIDPYSYVNWNTINNKNGNSSFLEDIKSSGLKINASSKNYCPLGTFKSSCDYIVGGGG